MINETSFNHSRRRLLEIYHTERAIANLDLIHSSRIKKVFRTSETSESYLHKRGVHAVLRELGIEK